MHHGSRSPAGALGTSAGAAAEHPLEHLAHRQPLRLADAERIAARPAQARQANATAGVPIATSASQAADWQRSLSTALNWQDVLELPEPLDEAARVAAQRPGGDRFNYTTWSAELDGLLKRPLPGTLQPGHVSSTAEPMPLAALGFVDGDPPPRMLQGRGLDNAKHVPKHRSGWRGLLILSVTALAMAGVVGGAVYGLAPPETKSFLDGAGILLDRLQIAVVR